MLGGCQQMLILELEMMSVTYVMCFVSASSFQRLIFLASQRLLANAPLSFPYDFHDFIAPE